MLSIIIPTLNEEKYLPLLLLSLAKQQTKQQNFREEYEVIVADAGSKDKTVAIAKSFGCKVVKGGLPAKGRNEGAKVAKGELLLFLDADLKLPPDFLEKSLKEFRNRKLDIASYCLEPQTNKKIIKTGFVLLYNRPITFSQRILAHGSGAILVKKEIFKKVKGFDEDIKLAEDHYFVRQASKIGKFGVIKSIRIHIHLRRFQADGYLKTCLKYLLCQLYMFSGKPVKSNIFKYKFGHYPKRKK
ncbi:MAG: glycosyltransferase [bacterium]|nr:glycosyltransferase [bacterium]